MYNCGSGGARNAKSASSLGRCSTLPLIAGAEDVQVIRSKKNCHLRELGPQLRDYSLDEEIPKLHPLKSFLSRRYRVEHRTLRLPETRNSNCWQNTHERRSGRRDDGVDTEFATYNHENKLDFCLMTLKPEMAEVLKDLVEFS